MLKHASAIHTAKCTKILGGSLVDAIAGRLKKKKNEDKIEVSEQSRKGQADQKENEDKGKSPKSKVHDAPLQQTSTEKKQECITGQLFRDIFKDKVEAEGGTITANGAGKAAF